MDEHKKKRLLYLIFGWAWALMGAVFIFAENYNTASWSFMIAMMAATIVQKIDIIIRLLDWQDASDDLLISLTLRAARLEAECDKVKATGVC